MTDSQSQAGQVLAYRSKEKAAPPKPVCLKCSTTMLEGVTVTGAQSAASISYWVEGQTHRWWLGILRLPKGKRYEIITFRCPACGYLESYSPPG